MIDKETADRLVAECSEYRQRVRDLEAQLHAIKYELMGGEDAPGSASLATVDDCKKEIERLRGIEFSARSLVERFYKSE